MSNNEGKNKDDDSKTPNRLSELITLLTRTGKIKDEKQFLDELHISSDTLRSYKNGNRRIPVQMLIGLANKYGFTLDWYYKRTDYFNEFDFALTLLSQAIKPKQRQQSHVIRGERFFSNEIDLYINSDFFSLLAAAQKLDYERESDLSLSAEAYRERRDTLFLKFSEQCESLRIAGFNEKRAIKIDNIELKD